MACQCLKLNEPAEKNTIRETPPWEKSRICRIGSDLPEYGKETWAREGCSPGTQKIGRICREDARWTTHSIGRSEERNCSLWISLTVFRFVRGFTAGMALRRLTTESASPYIPSVPPAVHCCCFTLRRRSLTPD